MIRKFLIRLSNSHCFFVLLLVLLAIFSHPQWFNLSSIISWGDWYYWPKTIVADLYKLWSPWIGFYDLGFPNVQINFVSFMSIWSFLFHFGVSYDTSSKLTIFIPIAILSFLSPYILSYRFTKDKVIAFACAIFYGTTTYGLFIQPPIQIVYSMAPLILYLFLLALDKNKLKFWIIFSFVFSLGMTYEIRIVVIISFVLLIFLLGQFSIKDRKTIIYLILTALIIILLNLYWIIPTIFGGAEGISQITSRSVWGDNLFDISHSFTIFNWLWTNSYPNKSFVQQNIIIYFWIFPVIAFSSFLLIKKKFNKNLVLFGTLALIGIFLTKQSSIPITESYRILYNYFPGFSIFREASKFYLLTSIGYLGLIGYTLYYLRNSKFFKLVVVIIISCSIFTLKPLFTGEIGTLFANREIPNGYIELSNYVENQDGFYRTLWVPTYSRWAEYDSSHPMASAVNLINTTWLPFIKNHDPKKSENELMIDLLKRKDSYQILSQASIRYIAVPIRDFKNDDDFIDAFGKDRNYLISNLNSLKYLKKIKSFGGIAIYENTNYLPLISDQNGKNLYPQTVGPNEFQFYLNMPNNKIYFSQSFSRNWKIRSGSFNWLEAVRNKNYFSREATHSRSLAGTNIYELNNFNKKQIVTLYYEPQSFYYFGLIFSLSALLVLTILLLFLILSKNETI